VKRYYLIILGGVFLSVTGCEALFADLGKIKIKKRKFLFKNNV